MSVDKVDSSGDPVEVGVADDLDELVDAPLGVDVLDVGLVLLDQPVQGQGVQPHSVVHVTDVLGRMDGVVSRDDKGNCIRNRIYLPAVENTGL